MPGEVLFWASCAVAAIFAIGMLVAGLLGGSPYIPRVERDSLRHRLSQSGEQSDVQKSRRVPAQPVAQGQGDGAEIESSRPRHYACGIPFLARADGGEHASDADDAREGQDAAWPVGSGR